MFDSSVNPPDYRKYLVFLLTEASFVCDELGYNLPFTLQLVEGYEDIEKLYLLSPVSELPIRCKLVLAMLGLHNTAPALQAVFSQVNAERA